MDMLRVTLLAADVTMVIYMVVNRAKNFAPVKAASATIACYQKTNLFNNDPT